LVCASDPIVKHKINKMKKLMSVIAGLVIMTSVINAQSTNDTGGTVIHAWEDFLGSATTNLIVVPYGISSTDFTKFGGGLALGYKLSDNVVPFIRIENYNGDFFMPSGTIQLQVPVHLGGLTVIPLAYTGVAVPLGKHINDPVVGLVGTGAALRLGKQFDFLAAYEMRSGVGNQICIGLGWKPNGW